MKTVINIFILQLWLMLTAPCIFGQSNDNIKLNQIKISTFNFLDPINPGIELSYERYHPKHGTSTALSAMYLAQLLYISPYDAFSGYKLGVEEKFFFDDTPNIKPYASVEFKYYNASLVNVLYFDQTNPISDSSGYVEPYPDSVSITKQMVMLTWKVGVAMHMKRFVMDFSLGGGVKYKDVRHFGRISPDDTLENTNHPSAINIALKEGNYYAYTIVFQLKFGFMF